MFTLKWSSSERLHSDRLLRYPQMLGSPGTNVLAYSALFNDGESKKVLLNFQRNRQEKKIRLKSFRS